ncbi:MAG: DUF3575 domain-containing protein [Saprospiraceae bacterium]|nr:DUF3575 domain-containing protein [Candidatus Opimibacter iunctus]
MNRHITLLLMLCLSLNGAISLQAQSDTGKQDIMKADRIRKNTIRINVTNPLIFGDRSLILGYERTIGEHQSFSINGGLAKLPKFNLISIVDDSIVQLYKDSKDKGFLFTGDYRFYLASENKYRAPRGLYIGPFVSYAYMGRENTWNLNTETFHGEVNTDFSFQTTAIGAQLGYQFVLWKRVALDFVLIGPSVAWYSLNAKLDTNLEADDESALYAKIDEILSERFPGYTFVLDDVDFKKTGSTNTRSFGFRYTIHLGYRF